MTRGLPWVKISKVMPHPKCPLSPGKGGKPYGKKNQIIPVKIQYGLTVTKLILRH